MGKLKIAPIFVGIIVRAPSPRTWVARSIGESAVRRPLFSVQRERENIGNSRGVGRELGAGVRRRTSCRRMSISASRIGFKRAYL